MKRTHWRRLLLAMSLATVLLLVWNQFGMASRLVIDGRSGLPVQVRDDRAGPNHGHSVGTLTRSGSALMLDCDVRPGYQYPFCLMSIRLGAAPAGVDLSGYDSLQVWLSASGPEPRQQVRFAIRNYNPGYSRPDDEESLKNQEVIFHPDEGLPLQLRLSQFSVASWWMEEHKLPLAYAGLEFDHIIALDLTTASELQNGPHRIRLERIELHGKWISPAQLRLWLIGLWVLAALAYLAVDAAQARRQLAASRRSQATLRQINEALRMESAAFASQARLDPLTGLLNRKGLGDLLQERSQLAQPLFPLSLIFIDIDHFKRINDAHGHAVGDEVIREAAECIRQHVQRSDLVTRWGGEEFLLVCPHTSLQEAAGLAERLRALLAGWHWPRQLAVSCSFGVADAASGQQLREGIDRADRAMFEAKRSGRNRVCTEGEATEPAAA